MIESRNPETGLPLHIGQDVPKPGSNQGALIPDEFLPHSPKPYHQSLPANEHVVAIAGEAMQIITGE